MPNCLAAAENPWACTTAISTDSPFRSAVDFVTLWISVVQIRWIINSIDPNYDARSYETEHFMNIDINKANSWALAVGRLLMAIIFVAAGAGKIANFPGTQGYMQSMGIPGILLPLVILTELGGGLAILLGYKVRLVSVLLASFCIVSGAIFHHNFSDQTQAIMFMKNLAMAGGFLALFVSGAGSFSLDSRLQRKL